MQDEHDFSAEGGCACGGVRYRMTSGPLFVHCCHCRWCQRESGAAFALNALIEADRVEILKGVSAPVVVPSHSGKGQEFHRCPDCQIALWSHYAGMGAKLCFIRVGTLDNPDVLAPDIHIFTSTKQAWVNLEGAALIVAEYYSKKDFWPAESLERWRVLEG